MKFVVEKELENGWSRWVQPIKRGYRLACCDCSLVHTIDFRIKKGRVQFRARRNNISTALLRRSNKHKAKSAVEGKP